MHPDTALSATKDIAANQDEFMSMYSSQIIGINQDELGSPWRAAGSSFVLFTIGALVPLGPWMFGFNDLTAILVAIGLTALAGLFVGGYTARSSGRSVWYGSLRQLLIIVLSAGVTYGIGHIFGVVTA